MYNSSHQHCYNNVLPAFDLQGAQHSLPVTFVTLPGKLSLWSVCYISENQRHCLKMNGWRYLNCQTAEPFERTRQLTTNCGCNVTLPMTAAVPCASRMILRLSTACWGQGWSRSKNTPAACATHRLPQYLLSVLIHNIKARDSWLTYDIHLSSY